MTETSWWGWCDDCECHIDNPMHAIAHRGVGKSPDPADLDRILAGENVQATRPDSGETRP